MSAPQGLAYFPGINQVQSASIEFCHGISPSLAHVVIAPQRNFIGEGGTFSLSCGNVLLDWPDAKVDQASFQRNSSGEIWRLSIFDRRWKWVGLGQISGSYNLRNDDGTVDSDTEKTPQQLAALLLDALAERDYDVGELPNGTRPLVEWDHDVPAEQLAHLADSLGCRVVLQLDNTVAVRLAGVGAELPTDNILENSLTINPPEKPDKLVIVWGRNRYQADLELEAVGKELDGTIKPIDDLSYKPSTGWTTTDIDHMTSVADLNLRALALECVYRWYRIKVPVDVPGYNDTIESLKQLLIETEQVDTETTVDGKQVNKKATVHGIYYAGSITKANNVTKLTSDYDAPGQAYKKSFTIDSQRRLVIFDEPVFRNIETSANPVKRTAGQATLRLRAAVKLRDRDTLAWERATKTLETGSNLGTRAQYVRHDELVLSFAPVYSDDYSSVSRVNDNRSELDPQADYYLHALLKAFEIEFPQSIKYPGLRPIELDGAIRHISFEVGAPFCTTTVSRNTERRNVVVPFGEMRLLEKTKEVVRKSTPVGKPAKDWTAQDLPSSNTQVA